MSPVETGTAMGTSIDLMKEDYKRVKKIAGSMGKSEKTVLHEAITTYANLQGINEEADDKTLKNVMSDAQSKVKWLQIGDKSISLNFKAVKPKKGAPLISDIIIENRKQ